jgi:hypothetical protein
MIRRQLFAALALALVFSADLVGAFEHIRQPIDIPMSDGQTLAADAYRPAEMGSWPVILIQTPYDKDTFALVFELEISQNPLLKSPDYVFVVLDWRGFFDSAGALYQGAPTRGQDGYDAVEWIAAQPWCDGNVGTWGASALGRVQLQTAAERPPSLKACAPLVHHLKDTYELNYPGGVYFRARNQFVVDYFGFSLIRDHPLEDFYWSLSESITGDPTAIDVPMLHISGWYDHQPVQTREAFEQIQELGGPNAAGRQWLMIGPWSHSFIDSAQQGELEFPDAQFASAQRCLEFFDFYLRGMDNGWESRPAIEYYRVNEAQWLEIDAWPPPNTAPRDFHLTPGGTLADAPATPGSFLEFASNPADPAPTIWGAVLQPNDEQGPGDLSALLGRTDTLAFATPPLAEPLRFEGDITGSIWIECDAVDADIALRLVHVTPSGEWNLISDGIRRASLRNTFSEREFLEPGVAYEVPVEMWPASALIPAGHQLGLIVAPANYELWDANPQDDSSFSDEEGATPTMANIRVLMDAAHPSRLTLPVLEAPQAGVSGWTIR